MCGAEKTGPPVVAAVELSVLEADPWNIRVELDCDAASWLVPEAEGLGFETELEEDIGAGGVADGVLAVEAVDEALDPPVPDVGPVCEAHPEARLAAATSAATPPVIRRVKMLILAYTKAPLLLWYRIETI
jgi:hypothetical protein